MVNITIFLEMEEWETCWLNYCQIGLFILAVVFNCDDLTKTGLYSTSGGSVFMIGSELLLQCQKMLGNIL